MQNYFRCQSSQNRCPAGTNRTYIWKQCQEGIFGRAQRSIDISMLIDLYAAFKI